MGVEGEEWRGWVPRGPELSVSLDLREEGSVKVRQIRPEVCSIYARLLPCILTRFETPYLWILNLIKKYT